MFVPYCTLYVDGQAVKVMHTLIDENDKILVRIEIPDESCGFRFFECFLPSYDVKTKYKINDAEYFFYMDFIRNNAHLLLSYARVGGVENE